MPRPRPEFVEYACELFAPLGAIRTRAMFSGWGFYCDDLFFALVIDETLRLKADALSADAFREAGGEPFRYSYKDGRTATLNYWTLPEEALEAPAAMRPWAQLALAAALRGRSGRRKRGTCSASFPPT